MLDNGVFGLGVRLLTGFRPLTTKHASKATTYNVCLSNRFEVAVNKEYEDSNKLHSGSLTAASIKVDFLPGPDTVTITHRDSAAERLFIGEYPVMVQVRTLKEEIAYANADANVKGDLIELLKSEIERLKNSMKAAHISGKQEKQQLHE